MSPLLASGSEPIAETLDVVVRRANFRMKCIAWVFALALITVAVRGVSLCVWPSAQALAFGEQTRVDKRQSPPLRGSIRDRAGRPLATSVSLPDVTVDPKMVVEAGEGEVTATLLAQTLWPDDWRSRAREWTATIEARGHAGKRYALVEPRVSVEMARRIRQLDLTGVQLYESYRRFYPDGQVAGQLVGYTNARDMGAAGLERAFNDELRGDVAAGGRPRTRQGIHLQASIDRDAHKGRDVILTLDRRIQRAAERSLDRVVEASKPAFASVVVVEVSTGDVLAMANVPSLDGNRMTGTPGFTNHAVASAIEPGSVFKPFTLAAAFEKDLFEVDSTLDTHNGVWREVTPWVRDDHKYGVLTLTEVIKYSSNIGTAKVGMKLGREGLFSALRDFGFGIRPGSGLPGEAAGRIGPYGWPSPRDVASVSYGQAVTSTPLQLAMAVAALGNEGRLMRPRVVREIVEPDGVVVQSFPPEVVRQVVSPSVARNVVDMMVSVTEPGGTGEQARVDGFTVSGKTGTAQKSDGKGYGEERVASFVGLIPAEQPRFALAVVVDSPSEGSRYGGVVAGPVFSEVAREAVQVFGLAPDGPPHSGWVARSEPDWAADPVASARPPHLGARLRDDGSWVLPDLAGRNLRDAVRVLHAAGLSTVVKGSGRVVAQEPEAGSILTSRGAVELVLR